MKIVKEFIKTNILVFVILFIFNLIKHLIDLKVILENVQGIIGIPIAALTGGIIIGNPIVGYTLGSELLKIGISEPIVATFILSWLTVGFLQIPIEAQYFGKKFSLKRNILALILAIAFGLICFLVF